MTVEQIVRDILTAAIRAGLVFPNGDPQDMTAGELVVPANLLAGFLASERATHPDLG